ncbi:MAG: DUF3179 domain-containing protein [Bacteroidetes bacterium]|nr:DUF3179 domain-containing protein [Bacteroidota bacterium]
MRKWFYIGILGLILFEIANVYFIMPMPGSQRMNSLQLAWNLNHWRWLFRLLFAGLTLAGLPSAWKNRRWGARIPVGMLLGIAAAVGYLFNGPMTASTMFHEMKVKRFSPPEKNLVPEDKLIIGVEINGEARAYAIQHVAYHHRVFDTLGNKAIMVTYCSVCRTGRVFEPVVDGVRENFRLVGMDHFNAMFEDKKTGTWWRQATGEAVAGPLKGKSLPEIPCRQMTLQQWLNMYPNSKILQPDPAFAADYDRLKNYDRGNMKGNLTRSDTGSWNEKSWVVGVIVGSQAKAYDWNRLKKERIIQDSVAGKHIILWISKDNKSHYVWAFPTERPFKKTTWLETEGNDLSGWEGLRISPGGEFTSLPRIPGNTFRMEPVASYQEFWHSWRTFHPETLKY